MKVSPCSAKVITSLTPVLLFDVSKAIRSFGGSIWLVQPLEHCTLFRASIGKKNCRIIVPRLGEAIGAIPDESNSFTVWSIGELRAWLSTL